MAVSADFNGCDYQCSLCGTMFLLADTNPHIFGTVLINMFVFNPLNGVAANLTLCRPCHNDISPTIHNPEDEDDDDDDDNATLLAAMRNINGNDLVSMFQIENENDEVLGFIPMNTSPILDAILAVTTNDPRVTPEESSDPK